MKLAAKLILIFMLGVFAVVALFSWQTIQQQRRWTQEMHQESAADLVEALKPSLAEAYRDGGVVRVQETVEITKRTISGPKLRWLDGELTEDASQLTSPATQIQSRRTSSISVSNSDGTTTMHTWVPLPLDAEHTGAVEVIKPMTTTGWRLRESLLASLLSLLGVAALSAVVIYWGGLHLVGKPLQRLIAQVQDIGAGQLDQPVALRRNDELGHLSLAISDMSQRLSQQRDRLRTETDSRILTEKQLRHADRLGTLGTLSAGVAHELGTPLNVIAGRAGLILGGELTPEEVTLSARTIKSEAERMTNIVRQLLDFSRKASKHLETLDLDQLLEQTCALMQPLAKKAGVEIQRSDSHRSGSSTPLAISGDPGQIQQVITNLISNAIQAMPSGGQLTIALELDNAVPPEGVPPAREGFAAIDVSDTGCGMSEEVSQRAFEPFYTTKDVGVGTGLGLSIAYGIVRDHGGWMDVRSRPGEGSTFRVHLPLSPEAAHGVPTNNNHTEVL